MTLLQGSHGCLLPFWILLSPYCTPPHNEHALTSRMSGGRKNKLGLHGTVCFNSDSRLPLPKAGLSVDALEERLAGKKPPQTQAKLGTGTISPYDQPRIPFHNPCHRSMPVFVEQKCTHSHKLFPSKTLPCAAHRPLPISHWKLV